jgi:hypothetical protein
MTKFEQAILIVADSIEALRHSDLFRVLDECGDRAGLAAYISAKRPEFAAEVSEIMEEEFA